MNELPHPLGPGDKLTGTWISNLLRAVRRMKPLQGPGISTRVTPDGTVISAAVAAPRAAAPLAPFAVRLHKTENDSVGLWEIYLPTGCCNVGGACEPLNPPASETSGHEDDDPAWRSLGRINLGAFASGGASSDSNEIHAIVEVHVKPSVKVFGVDSLENTAVRRVIWASVRDQILDDYDRERPNYWLVERHHRDKAGDAFEADVADITATNRLEDGEWSEWSISISPRRTTPIDAAVPQGTGISGFDLMWVLATEQRTGSLPSGLALVVKKLLCIRQLAAAAGISITGDTMTDVASDVRYRTVKIYARINVTDLTGDNGIVEVLKDPEGVGISSPYVVWLPLYETMFNAVVSDYRPQSLTNLQLFHA